MILAGCYQSGLWIPGGSGESPYSHIDSSDLYCLAVRIQEEVNMKGIKVLILVICMVFLLVSFAATEEFKVYPGAKT